MEELVLLGLLMTVGFIAGSIGERIKLPRVALYVVVGVLFSDELLGHLFPFPLGSWSQALMDIALGLIAFIVGSELNWRSIKSQKKSIITGIFGQSVGTFVVVMIGVLGYSALFLSERHPVSNAVILGAIASATAPAATVAIIEEYRTKGPLTLMLLSIVAIDDALAIICFTIALSFTVTAAEASHFGMAFREIIGSLFLGGLLGSMLGWYARRIHSDELRLPLVLGAVFFTIGIAQVLHVSTLLSCMILGFISKLLYRHKTESWLRPMNDIREAIFLVFFTLAGTHFRLNVFYTSFWFIFAYILFRTLGKYGGAWAGTSIGGSPKKVSQNVGLGLLPQAGVAIGLALRARETGSFAGHGSLILNTILGSTIIFSLISPILTKKALTRADEIGKRD